MFRHTCDQELLGHWTEGPSGGRKAIMKGPYILLVYNWYDVDSSVLKTFHIPIYVEKQLSF